MRLSSEEVVWGITRPISGLSPSPTQQKDQLCGPFHATRLLGDAGVTEWEGGPLDQDLVAVHAGTMLPERDAGPQVPPGAVNWRDYRFELPRVPSDRSGTSARGLAEAVQQLSGGRLKCVPLSGRWTAAAVEGLLAGLADTPARLLANLRTGRLWGSRPPLATLLGALDGFEPPDPPAADWDVGHFVELVQLIRGRRAALVLVRDSYPSLGWAGVHLQPPGVVAAALIRGDGRGGGVLAVVPPGSAGEVGELASGLGLQTKIWDN